MKTLSLALQNHLVGECLTLAHCWKLTRRDSTVMGFTDHDRDLLVSGVTYAAATGFTPALNWYRCFDANWELTANTPAPRITAPALFIGGTGDPTLAYTPRDRVRDLVAGPYREVMLDGGHWLPEERPDAVNSALLECSRTI